MAALVALPARGAFRRARQDADGPPLPQGRRLLRLQAALPLLPRRLAAGRPHRARRRARRRLLPERRPALLRAVASRRPPGDVALLGHLRRPRPREGGRLLLRRPLRPRRHQHRPVPGGGVHGRARPPARPQPHGDRGARRLRAPRLQRVRPHLDAAGRRRRALALRGHRHRRRVPLGGAVPAGEPRPGEPGAALPRAQHRGDAGGLRTARRGQGTFPGRPAGYSRQHQRRRRLPQGHRHLGPHHRRPDLPGAAAGEGLLLGERRRRRPLRAPQLPGALQHVDARRRRRAGDLGRQLRQHLGEFPPRLHPRLRGGHGHGQHPRLETQLRPERPPRAVEPVGPPCDGAPESTSASARPATSSPTRRRRSSTIPAPRAATTARVASGSAASGRRRPSPCGSTTSTCSCHAR